MSTEMFGDLQVLVLDDKDTAAMSTKLLKLFPGVTTTPVNSVNEAKRLIDLQYWDIVFLDLNMDMDDSLPVDDRPSGGFKAYFYLRQQYQAASQEILPPLIVIYTGEDALHSTLKPFFTDKEEPGRPFSIIFKAQEKETGLLRDHLVNLEIDRFRNNFYWLHSGTSAERLLDKLVEDDDRQLIVNLADLRLSSSTNGSLPLRKVFPTLVGQVAGGMEESVLQLRDVLMEQNWLSKLNYVFHKSQPGGRFLHGDVGQWSDFADQLSILPHQVIKPIYDDMQISSPVTGKTYDSPVFANHSDYGEWLKSGAEDFKSKWSRWGEAFEYYKNGEPSTSVTLPGYIRNALTEVCGPGSGITVSYQSGDNDGEVRRLYVPASALIEVAREASLNSIARNKLITNLLIRVIQDSDNNSLSLDIADDGQGFDPDLAPWNPTFSHWQNALRGWCHVEVYTKHEGVLWLLTENGRTEYEDSLGVMQNGLGTVVRMRFSYRHDWEYGDEDHSVPKK